MNLVKNEGGNTVWEHGRLKMLAQCNKLFILDGSRLNLEIADDSVRLISGTPKDLQVALLSLTSEYNTIPLAGIATSAGA